MRCFLEGDVRAGRGYYCSTGIWYRPRAEGASDAAYQLDNWYHFVWLSGDQIVEQAVHNLDAINWCMGGPPALAYGTVYIQTGKESSSGQPAYLNAMDAETGELLFQSRVSAQWESYLAPTPYDGRVYVNGG